MWSTPSLPSLPGLLWLRMVAPDRFLSIDKIFTFKPSTYAKLNCLKYNCLYVLKIDMALNNLQWLRCPGFNPRSCHIKNFKNGT